MNPLLPLWILIGIFLFIIFISLVRSIRIVSARTALIIERLGRYASTLEAGFHILVPFIDKVRYRHNLKEQAIDVPVQPCFTLDNVRVDVDGVLYFRVVDPKKASYGIDDYQYATIQLAQTTMRSELGKIELDRSFEEREKINAAIVKVVDEASDPWGVKVTRYEIQNIRVPDQILEAMEMQVRAEREKRAEIARSQGEMEAKINYSIGVMEEAINRSEGENQRRVNEAEGKAVEVLALAKATAGSIEKLAQAIGQTGGEQALTLQVAESYIDVLDRLARQDTQLVLPLDLSNIESIMEIIHKLLGRNQSNSY